MTLRAIPFSIPPRWKKHASPLPRVDMKAVMGENTTISLTTLSSLYLGFSTALQCLCACIPALTGKIRCQLRRQQTTEVKRE